MLRQNEFLRVRRIFRPRPDCRGVMRSFSVLAVWNPVAAIIPSSRDNRLILYSRKQVSYQFKLPSIPCHLQWPLRRRPCIRLVLSVVPHYHSSSRPLKRKHHQAERENVFQRILRFRFESFNAAWPCSFCRCRRQSMYIYHRDLTLNCNGLKSPACIMCPAWIRPSNTFPNCPIPSQDHLFDHA